MSLNPGDVHGGNSDFASRYQSVIPFTNGFLIFSLISQ